MFFKKKHFYFLGYPIFKGRSTPINSFTFRWRDVGFIRAGLFFILSLQQWANQAGVVSQMNTYQSVSGEGAAVLILISCTYLRLDELISQLGVCYWKGGLLPCLQSPGCLCGLLGSASACRGGWRFGFSPVSCQVCQWHWGNDWEGWNCAAEKGGSVYECVPFLQQRAIKWVQLSCLAAPTGKVLFLWDNASRKE